MPESAPSPADLAGWLAYLEQLHPKAIALGLERVSELRDRLSLKPHFAIVTVAGTNGKGSTCAMLENIYLQAGYRVACYTSPHLLRYNERVRIGGREVDDAQLTEAFAAVERARGATPLTYFEFGTLAAMWHFIRAGVDVAILEVGLGGRLDAVNAFEPDCAIVTSIDLDHTEYLGDNRDSIGFEKAGIFRRGVPALCGDEATPATVITHARQIGADFRQIGVDFGYAVSEHGWTFWSAAANYTGLPLPALCGSFQLANAACAVAAVGCLQTRLPVAVTAISAGLRCIRLQGRFQSLGGRPEVILDVAHNPHAARALADNLRSRPCCGHTLAVFAILRDKDIAGVVHALAEEVDAWFIGGIHSLRGTDAATLAATLEAILKIKVQHAEDVAGAYRLAYEYANENDRIIAFGSFYTVAEVLAASTAVRDMEDMQKFVVNESLDKLAK